MVLNDEIENKLLKSDFKRIRQLSCLVNDIPFHVTHVHDPATNQRHVSLHAVLGYLPFSAESQDRRAALLSIIDTGYLLPKVRLGIDHQGKIFAAARYSTTTDALTDFLFQPLFSFLQETQPMIDLIGTYL